MVHETERLVLGGGERRRERRHLLLPALHALQNAKGWISPGGLNHVCDLLQVPPAEAYGVATFYEMFRTDEPSPRGDVTHVCIDAACQISANEELMAEIESRGGKVHRSPCLGQCERAPAQFVQSVGRADFVPADAAVTEVRIPQQSDSSLRLLSRVGRVDPTSLESYREHGGYVTLDQAIEMGPEAVCDAVADSGLSGRGGAAFPTGVKWKAVAAERGRPKHVVANCDESEPGTFKDRIVMESDPFALVEAMTLAGLATGAENGWIYIRGEYPLATARLQNAIHEARAAGLLGTDVAGSGRTFDIEIRRGAGAYICGEETALFASLEGFRGEPRSKPAVSHNARAVSGADCDQQPGDAAQRDRHRSLRRRRLPQPRHRELTGYEASLSEWRVAAPGVYEVEFGATLGDVLALAGGLTGSGRLAAVLMGGAAGSFVGPDALDMPLTLEATRERGTTLGSGVVMAFTDEIDMTDVLVRISEFFRNESCGQCVPCRIGTVRQNETMVQIQKTGSLSPERRRLIDDIAEVMVDASICGLGHTAASAINSALALGLIGETP